MNWAWPSWFDLSWHSPSFPMWLTLAAAGFFAILMLITLVNAEKSVANGALTVITLLAVGIAVAATIRSYSPLASREAASEVRSAPAAVAALPALSCLDDLAGDVVLGVCERAVFGSAESTAAAVSYVAAQISQLTALGDAVSAAKSMPPELQAMRRSIEHDRYGLVAQVLQARDHCTPTDCAVFRSLTDNHQIITNMDEHLYETLVNRYAAIWTAPPPATVAGAPGVGALAGYPPSVPTGRPTNADFPSSASTPAVSIMSPEPGTARAAAPPAATSALPAARPSPSPSQTPAPAAVAAAKKPAPKRPAPAPAPPAQPVQISPSPAAPAASND